MVSRRRFCSTLIAGTSALSLSKSFGGPRDRVMAGVGMRASKLATGKKVVATVHPLASRAAIDVYEKGGNAIDAAIAAALTLGVVDGHNSGLGGGCLILIRTKNGTIHAIDGREKAPAAASAEMYLKDGKPQVELSQTGPLAIAVPGQLAALHKLHKLHGVSAWADLFSPAIVAAQNGYDVGPATHNAIAAELEHLKKFEASRSTLTAPNGSAIGIGDQLRQPELAETLRQIAAHGPDWFYLGDFAKRASAYIKWLGGIVTPSDFASYSAVERKPLRTSYRKFQIVGFPSPSSGGIHIAQMLHILENFDVQKIHQESKAQFFHLLAETMKLAFADRAHWLGDSDFVSVPEFLIDPNYGKQLAKRIDLNKATEVVGHGTGLDDANDKKHTTHLTTADSDGNWVAITNTVNTSWGSKVMVPGTGVMMNNEMDDFSIAPGVPNAFGLIGSAANAVAPNKRPLSSMSPTMVLQVDGTPWMTCGAAGGPKIINSTLQNIIRCVDFGQSIAESIASARIHQQWRPDSLYVEPGLGGTRRSSEASNEPDSQPDQLAKELESKGHSIKSSNILAIAQGIQVTEKGLLAASDPRTSSSAMAR